MTFTVPDWLAENIAWVTVATGGMGLGTYLLKTWGRGKIQRKGDEALVQMIKIVQENTAAFTGLDKTMQDNKGISLSLAASLVSVEKALAAIVERLNYIEQPVHKVRHG